MRVSIIIPIYKPQGYLWECLDSIKEQTIASCSYEIILILNGCNEPYKSQINRYIENNLSGYNVVFMHTDIGGVSNARNIGLECAKGEYIAFIDDDDLISPNYLEELLSQVSVNSIAVSNSKYFTENVKTCIPGYYNKVIQRVRKTNPSNLFLRRSFLSPVAFKLIHKDIIGHRRYDTSFRNGEDSIFMFEISDRIKAINICEDCCYYVRVRKKSASHTQPLLYRINKSRFVFGKYTQIYVKNITGYNFWLYLSRLFGIILWIMRVR